MSGLIATLTVNRDRMALAADEGFTTATAVADALVGSGVAQSTLSVDWKGETQPAVATGDNVKEPLNRRSTIDINF